MTRPVSEIIPPHLAVEALRDSGYRNTAYAIAELIDNSIQAGATDICMVGVEKPQKLGSKEVSRISNIAVLDNGEGMSAQTLRLALQFGNSSRLNDRSGMGRFGMGLPNASISQSRRIDVWTWQNGVDNALHSYLDVNEIKEGKLTTVPEPSHEPLPNEWRNLPIQVGISGTLILWSDLDHHKISWRKAQTTLGRTEEIIGRVYRKFLDAGSVRIKVLIYADDELQQDYSLQINDPLYLMNHSTTPAPFDETPMFQSWGKPEIFSIESGNKKHEITIRMSWAKQQTIPEGRGDRGHTPYGKHAAKNIGVSVLREKRELKLDTSWVNSYDPVDRWWGAEVEFPAFLDEVFGVTNNKQNANIFSNLAKFDWEDDKLPGESFADYTTRLTESGDPRGLLLPVAEHIKNQISLIKEKLKSPR